MSEPMHVEVQDQFSSYIDQELSADARERFLEHIQRCPNCEHSLDQFEQTIAAVRGLPRHKAPHSFARQVLRRVKHRNRRQQAISDLFAGTLRVPSEAILPILLAACVAALLLYLAQQGH